MSFLKKISDYLTQTFNAANDFPEPEIRTEMEREGWRFDMHHALHPYMICTITSISTPEGQFVGGGDPEVQKRYEETVAQKKAKLGLTPQ